jgi:hypothetical protein
VNYVGHDQGDISIADIAGVMLNAAFMDALDSDAERLIRINQTLTLIEERRRAENLTGSARSRCSSSGHRSTWELWRPINSAACRPPFGISRGGSAPRPNAGPTS